MPELPPQPKPELADPFLNWNAPNMQQWKVPPGAFYVAGANYRPFPPPDEPGFTWKYDELTGFWNKIPKEANLFDELDAMHKALQQARPPEPPPEPGYKWYFDTGTWRWLKMAIINFGGVPWVEEPYPEFPGWITVGRKAQIIIGDVGVLIKRGHPKYDGQYLTPENGYDLAFCAGMSLNKAFGADRHLCLWGVYRKPIKREPNPHHSAPLPLP